MREKIIIGSYLSILLLFSVSFKGFTQKLPKVQQTSMQAPANIKIDGKANEWTNQFQAHNMATDLFYTLANDENNLYLIAKGTDANVINNIVGGGLKLTITLANKKEKSISITYPTSDRRDGKTQLYFSLRPRKGAIADTSARAADSTMVTNNYTLTQRSKWIKVHGVEGLDSLISVYNQDGIKAAGLFDIKKAYTIEIAISLKQLKLTADNTKINYNIRIDGREAVRAGPVPGQAMTPEYTEFLQKLNSVATQISAPTYFDGEYILSKK